MRYFRAGMIWLPLHLMEFEGIFEGNILQVEVNKMA
jgi:hypothetical protein